MLLMQMVHLAHEGPPDAGRIPVGPLASELSKL